MPLSDQRTLRSSRTTIRPMRPSVLREVNIRGILDLLRENHPCSRADLVRLSGLSAPTVSASIDYLCKSKLVEELGTGASNGGRPPGLLRFNSAYGHVVAADIGGSNLRIALANMEGTIIGKWSAKTRANRTPDKIVDLIANGVDELLKQYGISRKSVLAVAAGAPGITDVRAGIVLSAPHLSEWQNVPLRQLLKKKLGVPAAIENDVNLGAMGESWCGAAKGTPDFVFLAIGTGIGAGIFLNGKLYHGATWSAGEVGYMHVPGTPREVLSMDRPGSLESVIGGNGIEACWRALGKKSSARADGLPSNAKATQIFEFAESGNAAAREILQNTARILADSILNISVLLNTSLVVFGGGIGTSKPLIDATRRLIERNQFARPNLAMSLLGADAQLHGAVRLALDHAEMSLPVAGR